MSKTKPYGNPKTAHLLVIGHDPRLQESDTEAEYVFFVDYLEREPPTYKAALRKYGLAKAVVDYIAYLSDNKYGIHTLDKIYFTNLCNELLPRPEKKNQTVIIPNDKANHGISEIEEALGIGSFQLMLPMSLQVFYHLVRQGFVPNKSDDMKEFLKRAHPDEAFAKQGAYRPIRQKAFVNVCGNVYYHRRIPVIPVLHVKSWLRMVRREPYTTLMEKASYNIRNASLVHE
jgi:hypothetical protein